MPTLDKDAGSRTITNFVDTLLSLGFHVKFLVPNMYPLYSYTKLLQQKGVEVLHGEGFIYWKHEWEAYFKANINKFDAILLSRSSICTPFVKYLKKHNYPGSMIYYGHDLGFLRTKQELALTGNIALKKIIKKTKADEDFMYENVNHALVISHEEMEYLKKYITTPLHYIPPYFFEVNEVTPPYSERNGILFVGGFHHPPNQDAMRWFLNEIYPALYKENIKFTIAGSEMPEFIFEYKNKYKSLEVLPDVPIETLEMLYAATRIAIVPLQVGAGVKGKVIEAMAKGVPVVGTDRAFEGLNKNEAFIYKGYNTAAEIVENIILTYNNQQRWEQLSAFGKQYVKENFNKENMRQAFKDIIQ